MRPADPDAPAGHPDRLAAVVLAAGLSSRAGGRNKLVREIDGRPMVRRVVETVIAAGVGEVIVVTGHQPAAVAAALAGLDLRLAHNPGYRSGIGGSLATGVAAVPACAAGALVCLGDMPLVTADTIRRLVAAFDPAAGRDVCVPVRGGRRGHPVLFARRLFPDLRGLAGDVGGRAVLDAHARHLVEVAVDDDGVLSDFDGADAADTPAG